MKNDKRLISALLAVNILLTASGCGSKVNKTNDGEGENTTVIEETVNEDIEKENAQLEENKSELKEENDSNTNDDTNIDTNIDTNTEVEENNNIYEINRYACVTSDTPIYNDPSVMEEISFVDKCQKVFVMSKYDEFSLIEYDGVIGYVYSDIVELLPDLYVEVDISDQWVKLYKNGENILTSDVVTGKTSTPTRVGYFGITYKEYDTYLVGQGYRSHVYYWMPFDGGIGLHDAAWRSYDEFGGETYINNGSHGCVNMHDDTAKTIYDNVEAGTKVLVHK